MSSLGIITFIPQQFIFLCVTYWLLRHPDYPILTYRIAFPSWLSSRLTPKIVWKLEGEKVAWPWSGCRPRYQSDLWTMYPSLYGQLLVFQNSYENRVNISVLADCRKTKGKFSIWNLFTVSAWRYVAKKLVTAQLLIVNSEARIS